MFINSFFFSGAQLGGGDIYLALWGGAGGLHSPSIYDQRRRRNRLYFSDTRPGSGGLILAKISGLSSNQTLQLFAGGRGSNVGNQKVHSIGVQPIVLGGANSQYQASSGGAASAVAIAEADGTQNWLLVAPSGGGAGAAYGHERTGGSPLMGDRDGGHGLFVGQQLGRATVAASSRETANLTAYSRDTFSNTATNNTYRVWADGNDSTPRSGIAGSVWSSDPFEAVLNGRRGERATSSSYPPRGGAGAPDGYDGTVKRYRRYGEGGSGGIGYVAGYSGTYGLNERGTGALGGISVEFVAFDGEPNNESMQSGDLRQYDRVIALYNAANNSGGAGDLVKEVVDALGWKASPAAGETHWPPVLQDNADNFFSDPAVLGDPATTARRGSGTINGVTVAKYWPGQVGSPRPTNGDTGGDVIISGANRDNLNMTQANVEAQFPAYWSNSGAVMMRVGTDGVCIGFDTDDLQGGYATDIDAEGETGDLGEGARWLPTSGSSVGKLTASSANLRSAYSVSGWANSIVTPIATRSETDSGPITTRYSVGDTLPILFQVRNGDAALYALDTSDGTQNWEVSESISGAPSSSSTRSQLSFVPGSDTFVVHDTAGVQVIDHEAEPPVVINRDATGSVLTGTDSYGMTVDAYGYCYLTDEDGNLDIFETGDLDNDCPIVLTIANCFNRTTLTGRMGGLAYDHILDILWYSYDSRISWMEITRDAEDVPTGLLDYYLNNSGHYITRTLGSFGPDDKIFWIEAEELLQQNNDQLTTLSVSSIAPSLNPLTNDWTDDTVGGDFVFSMFGAGGGGGGKGDGSTATTEDGGAGGSGAFVEVRVRCPRLEAQSITFGLGVGDRGDGALGNTNGGAGGAGGSATVLWIKVGSSEEPIAFAAGGGGGGGAGEGANADGGYGGSAAGVTGSTGVGLQAQDGLGPNDVSAGDGGGGGAGTVAGVPAASANNGATPPAKTVATYGQTGGRGDRANSTGSGSGSDMGTGFFDALGASGGTPSNGEGGGGGGGGGFFAGAGGEHASGGNESGAGGGGGSSHVRIGSITVGGLTFEVEVLASEGGTLQTGAPTAVTQAAGTTKHFVSTATYGQGGNGAPETLSGSRAGSSGGDGAIFAGHYNNTTHTLLLTSHSTVAADTENPARTI